MSSRSRPRARSQGDHPRRPLSPEIRVLQDKPVSKLIHRTESRTGSRDHSADDQSTSRPPSILKKTLSRDPSPINLTSVERIAANIRINTDLRSRAHPDGVEASDSDMGIWMSVLADYFENVKGSTMPATYKNDIKRAVLDRAIPELARILNAFAPTEEKYKKYERIYNVVTKCRNRLDHPEVRHWEEEKDVEIMAKAFGKGLAKTMNRPSKLDIPEFTINNDLLERTREFKLWLDSFELKAEALNIYEPETKYKVLRASLGAPAVRYMESYPDVKDQENVYENYVQKAKNVYIMKNASVEARTRFRTIKQRSGEELQQYLNRLRENSDLCGWTSEEREQQMLEQLISGTVDEEYRKKIMVESMSLHEAISWAQTLTSVRATNRAINEHNGGQESTVHWNRAERPNQPRYHERNDHREKSADTQNQGYRDSRNRGNDQYRDHSGRQDDRRDPGSQRYHRDHRNQPQGASRSFERCKYCVLLHARGDENCPSYNETCHRCGERGHYARSGICKSKNQRNSDNRGPTTPNNDRNPQRIHYTQHPSDNFDHNPPLQYDRPETIFAATADSAVHAVLREQTPQQSLF